MINKFKEAYIPLREISIDEQLMLHKGRLVFRQYIPNKRAKFGIKFFSLCDTSGYLWNSEVYVGKSSVGDPGELCTSFGKSGAVVIRLIEELLGKGYHLYLDNWYTSHRLFEYLFQHKTVACGTMRKIRAKFPATFTSEKLQKGECVSVSNGSIMALKLRDKKEVYFLSSIHKRETVLTKKNDREGKPIKKERLVNDYNKFMGGVDKNDAVIGNYSSVRKCLKWTTKVFLHFLEEALYNAFVIFSSQNNIRFVDFKTSVVNDMLEYPGADAFHHSLQRKCGHHFTERLPPTEKNNAFSKRCVWCLKKRSGKTPVSDVLIVLKSLRCVLNPVLKNFICHNILHFC